MNVTPICLAIVPYPTFIEHPNAAYIYIFSLPEGNSLSEIPCVVRKINVATETRGD